MSDIENTPLDELQWKSPEWVNTFGLRTDNVLEYFSQSPFFDRTSNNQVLKMQQQFSTENYLARPYNLTLEDLKKMKGVEFIIAMVREPDFWVIRKEYRYSPTETKTLDDYYIIGSSVYMSPTIKSILSSRLLSTSLSLRNAMRVLQELPGFSPSKGHYYEFATKDAGDENKGLEKESANDKEQPHYQLPESAANAFSNLLNISLQKKSVYIDEMPIDSYANAKEE